MLKNFICLYSRFNQFPLTLTDILKPNRRYNLPFGRLDPDVVEGRRDLLQNYLRVRSSKIYICASISPVELQRLKISQNEICAELSVPKGNKTHYGVKWLCEHLTLRFIKLRISDQNINTNFY